MTETPSPASRSESKANMPGYEESYLGQIRKLVGDRKVIITAARAVVRDREGRVLFIRRRDNRKWAMPAGSQELDESITDCLRREVKEECGLEVISATPMAIYSCRSIVTAFGDPYHHRCSSWSTRGPESW